MEASADVSTASDHIWRRASRWLVEASADLSFGEKRSTFGDEHPVAGGGLSDLSFGERLEKPVKSPPVETKNPSGDRVEADPSLGEKRSTSVEKHPVAGGGFG